MESKQASKQEKVKRMMNVRVPIGGFESHGDISWEAHAAAVAHVCGLGAYIREQEVRIGREKEDRALQVGLIVWILRVKAKGWIEKSLRFPHVLLFHLLFRSSFLMPIMIATATPELCMVFAYFDRLSKTFWVQLVKHQLLVWAQAMISG